MFKTATEAFGTVDVLINNAGITKDGLVMRMKPAQWQDVIDVNLSGVFYCTQAFFKLAAKKRTGRIINISSVVGQIGNPGQANYVAAKAGVIGLTKTSAKELASRGITVNAIAPGYIATAMTDALPDSVKKMFVDIIPMKRFGTPEEVAHMVKFLVSDEAAYITGQVISINGGMLM